MKKVKFGVHEVSTIEIWAAGTLLFVAGAASAGWAVGKFSTTGNAADWSTCLAGVAAAAGTWAIGIGANRYARLGDQRQEAVARAAADRAQKIRAGQIHKLRLWAMQCNRAHTGMRRRTDAWAEKPTTIAGAYGLLDGTVVMLSQIDCSSPAWELLHHEDLSIQVDIGIRLAALARNVRRFKERNTDKRLQLVPETMGWKYPLETTELLSGSGDALLAAIARISDD